MQETYGEDPYLTGTLSVAFLRGIHGQHPRYMRATAGCKAFDLYAGPENIPIPRFDFDAKVLAWANFKLWCATTWGIYISTRNWQVRM